MSYLNACISLPIQKPLNEVSLENQSSSVKPFTFNKVNLFLLSTEHLKRPRNKIKNKRIIRKCITMQYLQAAFQPAKRSQSTSLVFLKWFSRICAYSICGECSRKKINNERSCDFCFLKQHLKKQEH